jgi:simple sugar transport system ATP-binding protein
MTETTAETAPRLELRNISKSFPGVLANDSVDFSVAPGEIHALLGENGAGKSTLVKIIYGVLHADDGEMLWEGKPVTVADPHAARNLGIGMVFQHFSLFEAMTVLENIALGVEKVADMKALAERVIEVSHAYGLPLDPDREVHTLSVGERQRIEIVRCLLQNPRLLIMDEPTSVLTPLLAPARRRRRSGSRFRGLTWMRITPSGYR